MKVSIVTDNSGAGMVTKAEPVLIDAFTNYLRSVELSDFENPDFYAHMREQLSRRSELVLGGGVSEGVLITEFLLR
jgi:flagellar FliL protein